MSAYTPEEIRAYFEANPDQATPEGIAAASAEYGVSIADIGAAYGLTPQEANAWMSVSTNEIGSSDNQMPQPTYTPEEIRSYFDTNPDQATPEGIAAASAEYGVPINEIGAAYGLTPAETSAWMAVSTNEIGSSDNQMPDPAPNAQADPAVPVGNVQFSVLSPQEYAQARVTNYVDSVIVNASGDITKIAETLARLNVARTTLRDAFNRLYPTTDLSYVMAVYDAAPSNSDGIQSTLTDPLADLERKFHQGTTEQTTMTQIADAAFSNASPADVLRIAAANNVTVADIGAQFGLTPTETAQWMAVPTNRIGSPNNQLASLASTATTAIVNAISSVIPSSSVSTVVQALTDIGKTDTTTNPPASPGLWDTIKSNPAMLLTAAVLAWKLIR